MALDGTALGLAISAKLASAGIDALDPALRHAAAWDAIGNAIVDYLKLNTDVVVTSVSGVTTGAGVSGPGTGRLT